MLKCFSYVSFLNFSDCLVRSALFLHPIFQMRNLRSRMSDLLLLSSCPPDILCHLKYFIFSILSTFHLHAPSWVCQWRSLVRYILPQILAVFNLLFICDSVLAFSLWPSLITMLISFTLESCSIYSKLCCTHMFCPMWLVHLCLYVCVCVFHFHKPMSHASLFLHRCLNCNKAQ